VAHGELQAKLVDLIENQNVPVEDACRRLKISPSTYYRFKRRERRDEVELQQLSVEKRAQLERLVEGAARPRTARAGGEARDAEWGGANSGDARARRAAPSRSARRTGA
jgi:hypothetical protein